MKVKELGDVKKEYGDIENVDMGNLQAIVRATLVQMAVSEVTEAEQKMTLARVQLQDPQLQLRNFVEAGTEANDSFFALLEEMKLEE